MSDMPRGCSDKSGWLDEISLASDGIEDSTILPSVEDIFAIISSPSNARDESIVLETAIATSIPKCKTSAESRGMEPGILCFSHCGPRVFCFQLPELCPACRTTLANQRFLLPFRLPYPFVKASQYPCSIVIKPTHGDFLHDYKVSEDLHIGVTTGKGKVVEFDRGGLAVGRPVDKCNSGWDECLVVYQTKEEPWVNYWDTVLEQFIQQDCWTTTKYNEETFNCYTFVLAFVRCLKQGGISEAAASKTKFCEKFVAPRTLSAVKYISLYRLLKDRGYFVYRPNKQ